MLGRTKVFCVSAFLLFVIFLTGINGHDKIQELTQASLASSPPLYVPRSVEELITISDASPAGICWVPYDQEYVSSQITTWIDQSTPYKEKMPQLQAMEIFNANIGPARMTLTSSTKDKITIYPAFYIETTEKAHASIYKDEHGIVTTTPNSQRQVQYVQNVLVVHYGGKNTCIKSKPLYDWLKWGQWKSEFERK